MKHLELLHEINRAEGAKRELWPAGVSGASSMRKSITYIPEVSPLANFLEPLCGKEVNF
ncbi:MAG: hypothetical protein R2681_15350 [Pyrinomonadaceae bacterium]